MMKRIIVGSIIGIVIVGISVFYYLNKPEPVIDSVYRAVPLDATLLIDIKDYKIFRDNLLQENQLWKELSYLPLFVDINRKLKFTDSLIRQNPDITALFTSNKCPLLVSGHQTGKDNIQLVYYFKIDNEKDFDKIGKMIDKYRNKSLEITSRSYEGATIHDVFFPGRRSDNFSYTWSHGLMMLSTSSILLEDGIRQLSAQESLLNKNDLTEIIKTAGKNAPVNLYFNIEHLPQLTLKFIQAKYKKELSFLTDLGSWIELDLNLKPDMLIFNGFSINTSDKPSLISVFGGQKPLKLEIFEKIPSLAHTFVVLGINKYAVYRNEYLRLLKSNDEAERMDKITNELKENYNVDLINSFQELFDQEISIAFAGGTTDSIGKEAWTIIRTKNEEDAEKFLKSLVTGYAAKNELNVNDLMSKVKVDNNQEIKIWPLPFVNVPFALFGKMFSSNQSQWCSLINNYMVFAESKEMLILYYQYTNQNSTISTDLNFNKFSDFFSSQSNFFFYTRPSGALGFYANFLKPGITEALSLQQKHVNKINTLVYQFNINEQNLMYHNLFVRYFADSTDHQRIINSDGTRIEGKIVNKPVLITNTPTKEDDAEVFIQDDLNQIYLVNKFERIVWKLKIPEPIISDVYQVDFYKNGKQQILFNTRTKLYLIDRNGNYIEKYPVPLPEAASNGLAVFDYEKNRDYRIFIAGENRKIYAFDKNGEIIEQWSSDVAKSDIRQPVQFFRIEGKDYLIYNDKFHLYAVDRKGKKIFYTEKLDISINNRPSLINSKSRKEARLVITSTSGSIYSIGLDGKTKITDFGKFPENHWFDVYDIDNDHTKDYIIAWDKNLKVITQKNKEIFSVKLENPISYRPIFFELQKKYSIGLVLHDDEKIFLYNNKGELCKGFPMKGNTQFSIGVLDKQENKLNLIVGNNNNLFYHNIVQ